MKKFNTMIKRVITSLIVSFAIHPALANPAECISKHQLHKMQSSTLDEIRVFMRDIQWYFNGAATNQTYDYFSISLPYDLVRWESPNRQNIELYYGKGKNSIVIYQTTSVCFNHLISELQKNSKGQSSIETDYLITTFNIDATTFAFREYKNDYSTRKFTILVYDKKSLDLEISTALNSRTETPGNENTDNSAKQEEVVSFVSKEPEYPGGIESLYKDVYSLIIYPEFERQNNIQGTVYVSFIVEKNGTISEIKVDRGVNGGANLSTEAIRVLQYLKQFSPALMGSKPVRYRYRLPIRFILK